MTAPTEAGAVERTLTELRARVKHMADEAPVRCRRAERRLHLVGGVFQLLCLGIDGVGLGN
jgi:hypothetical protein